MDRLLELTGSLIEGKNGALPQLEPFRDRVGRFLNDGENALEESEVAKEARKYGVDFHFKNMSDWFFKAKRNCTYYDFDTPEDKAFLDSELDRILKAVCNKVF